MGEDFIKTTDYSVAAAIRNELKRLKITPKYSNMSDFTKFSKEELASIKRLDLHSNSFKDISILEYCVNLTDLSIKSKNAKYQKSTGLSYDEELFSFESKQSLITDFSVISSLKNLEYLEIDSIDGLESLDLTGLNKLQCLYLKYNPNLTEIKGLSELPQLCELKLIKNGLRDSFDLPNLLRKQLGSFEIDFDLYPALIHQYPDLIETLEYYRRNGGTYKWAENVSNTKLNYLDVYRLDKMDKKADEIIRNIIGPEFTELEKISAIYAYIIQNVKYDYESLNAAKKGEHNSAWDKASKNMGEFISTFLLRRQSSFNAIMENTCVCEGYTNMMHYLLQKVGVRSYTCSCSSDANVKLAGRNTNHSIIKVEYEGNWYYFDPTWDADRSTLKWFFKTKDEFSKKHSLSLTERNVKSPTRNITNHQLTEVLQRVIAERDSGKIRKDNEIRMVSKMNPEEFAKYSLKNIQPQLSSLRQKYEELSIKIEDLMKQSQMGNASYYKAQIDSLIVQRDIIIEQISSLVRDEKKFLETIAQVEEDRHQAILRKIEKMYNIRISSISGYGYRQDLGGLQELLKDKTQLLDERTRLFSLISDSVQGGMIDSKTANELRSAVLKEFDRMSAKAPTRDESISQDKEKTEEIEHGRGMKRGGL